MILRSSNAHTHIRCYQIDINLNQLVPHIHGFFLYRTRAAGFGHAKMKDNRKTYGIHTTWMANNYFCSNRIRWERYPEEKKRLNALAKRRRREIEGGSQPKTGSVSVSVALLNINPFLLQFNYYDAFVFFVFSVSLRLASWLMPYCYFLTRKMSNFEKG